MADVHNAALTLQQVITSVSERADTHHWRLVGSTPKCLCCLLDADDTTMQCVLELCGLCDAEKSQFKIDNDWNIFAPCQMIPFTLKL